jgi:hypothetical protein
MMGSSLFKWQQAEGERGINRQLSARGLYGSGAGLETLARFNAQLLGEESMRYWERLYNMTALGSNAASHMATNTSATGRSLADMLSRTGTAAAVSEGDAMRSIASIGPALGRTISGGFGDYLQLPLMNASINALNKYGGGGSRTGSPMNPSYDLLGSDSYSTFSG